uniref:Uncharacterized protein n=1 Tax=Anopheles merus TaxID=30066 RepID=A0A182UVM1_ANOME
MVALVQNGGEIDQTHNAVSGVTDTCFLRQTLGLVKSPTAGTLALEVALLPLGGVDAWCELPKAGAESGRVPALIGVDTALTEADGPWLLLALIVSVHWYKQERGHDGDERSVDSVGLIRQQIHFRRKNSEKGMLLLLLLLLLPGPYGNAALMRTYFRVYIVLGRTLHETISFTFI